MVYKPKYSKPAKDLHDVDIQNTALSTTSSYVTYNGSSIGGYPKVDIDHNHQFSGNGSDLGTITRITVTGKNVGSPPGYGYDFTSGYDLEISLCGVKKKYKDCKVADVSFNRTEDNWSNTVDYTVVFESYGGVSSGSSGSSGSGGNNSLIVSVTDNWSAEPLEDSFYSSYTYGSTGSNNLGPTPSTSNTWSNAGPRYRITHRTSAKAVNPRSPDLAWRAAKKWVCGRTRNQGAYYSGNKIYNHIASISYDPVEGSYERTDTWVETSGGKQYSDLTIEKSTDSTGLETIRLQGQEQALFAGYYGGTPDTCTGSGSDISSGSSGSRDSSGSANLYSNVSFNSANLYRIANSIASSGVTINRLPVSESVSHDVGKGLISYSYEYNDRAFYICTNSSGACKHVRSENVNITDTGDTIPVFSENFVIGRTLGPVIQDLGTNQSFKKDVTVELSVAAGKGTLNGPPGNLGSKVSNVIKKLAPFYSSGGNNIDGFNMKTADNTTWLPTEGRYSRSVSWTYQYCSSGDMP